MNLITINTNTINNQEIQTVNARELHSFLESKRDFSNWIQERIKNYGFIDGMDFTTNLLKTPNGGRPRTEYHLSLDMAKELSMVERNDKGKQARQYFIECEKKALVFDPVKALNDPTVLRNVLANYSEKVIELEHKVKEIEPKAKGFDVISFADGAICITDAAKTLQIKPKNLFGFLSSNKWIYRRAGNKNWIAYQDKIQQQLLTHKITTIINAHGDEYIREQVLVTPKGIAKLSKSITLMEA